jgi:regulator of cell morphogenesis and NO signaling
MGLTISSTVGQLVVERPARARIFEQHGIDYCCGGKLSLADACAKRGLDAAAVLAAIEAADAPSSAEPDWAGVSLTELADHIEQTHHDYLRAELPRLSAMSKKVAAVHGDERPELVQLAQVFARFAGELYEHMLKEETIAFPMIRAIERGERADAGPEDLGCPISVMVQEHDEAGRALEKMRELTSDYTPPMAACNTYRALFDSLAQLERDMHAHVHKENNILFPRALQAEAAR